MNNSFVSNMYGKNSQAVPQADKNPNRVTGGLRGHGADHFTMLGEDGNEQKIPTHKYVAALEEKLRQQDTLIKVLERKQKRLEQTQEGIERRLMSYERRT